MPISNNTNTLAGHEIGVSPQTSGITRQLDVERSRANYQYRIKISEQKATKLRQYAYKMVYRWTMSEKLQMIQSYGESDLVKDKNDEEEVNRQLVETLLVNLSEGELNSIVQQVNYTERELMNNINTLNNHHNAELEAAMRFKAAGMPANAKAQSAGGSQAAQKAAFEPSKNGFTVNSILKKELIEILKTYSKAKLGSLANEMGIEYEDGASPAMVRDDIIREIGYYVAMVTGKSKGMMNITAGAVTGAKKLLKMTSFAWAIGEVPVSARERAQLLAKAKEAKAMADSRNKIIGDKKSSKLLSKRKAEKYLKKYEGNNGSAKIDYLRTLSYNELMNRASEMGILVNNKMSVDQIIAQILKKEDFAVKQQNKLVKQYAKQIKRGRLAAANDTVKKANALYKFTSTPNMGSNDGKDDKQKGLLSGASGPGSIPMIKIDEAGNILSEMIDVAVPVVIVGQTNAGLNKNAVEIRKARDTNARIDEANSDPIVRLLLEREPGLSLDDAIKKANEIKSSKKERKTFLKDIDQNKIKGNKKNMNEINIYDLPKFSMAPTNAQLDPLSIAGPAPIVNVTTTGGGGGGAGLTPGPKDKEFRPWIENKDDGTPTDEKKKFLERIDNMTKVSSKETLPDHSKDMDGVEENYTAKWKKGDDGKMHLMEDKPDGKEINDKKFFNTAAKKMGFRNIYRKPAQPVWVLNGYTEYLNTNVEKGFDKVVSAESAIYTYLSSSLPVLFAGLQQAGTAFNMEGPAAAAATVMDNVMAAIDVVFSNMKKLGDDDAVQMYATGGTGKASKAKVSLSNLAGSYSQFMTGDSLDGSENPEMVSIDWNNRQFAVKPTKPTVDGVNKLSDNERLTAFGISFREGTIKYKNEITGETEDNIALKVYPVTPGINDKVEVNGQSISLIEMMAGMYGSVVSIEGLLGQSVELSKAIAAKPVATQAPVSSPIDTSGDTFPTNLDSILRGE